MTESVYTANDIAILLNVKLPTAYKIIQVLNRDLKSMGCYTVSGRVSRSYFNEKYAIEKAPAVTGASRKN